MIEKVNAFHPDKVADRIAGAIVDLAYTKQDNPKVAVEVLIGHGECNVIVESSVTFTQKQIEKIVHKIAGEDITVNLKSVPQDEHLANNQSEEIKCGDNGIFKGVPLTQEERDLSNIARKLGDTYQSDGKYILDKGNLIICQSHIDDDIANTLKEYYRDNFHYNVTINPLGPWTGGLDVDSGATNRKLGSDMAQSVTGGGLSGKDLSKADVSANIYAFYKAQELNKPIEMLCAIGDTKVLCRVGRKETYIPYSEIVEFARNVIKSLGGFEAFSAYGLY